MSRATLGCMIVDGEVSMYQDDWTYMNVNKNRLGVYSISRILFVYENFRR